MDPPAVDFQARLGFLIAIRRSTTQQADRDSLSNYVHCTGALSLPPGEYFKTPPGTESYRELSQEHLIRAQWAIEQLEAVLRHHGLSNADPLNDDTRNCQRQDDSDCWTVSFDAAVQEHQCSQYHWIGVGLTSPNIRAGSLRFEKELEQVLFILNKKLLTVANSDTRLNILVSLPKGNVSLDDLKVIASMIWTADPLLDELHPPHCRPGSLSNLGLQYTKLARDYPIHIRTELASTVEIEDPWNNRLTPNRHPLEILPHPGKLNRIRFSSGFEKIRHADSVQSLVDLFEISILDAGEYPQVRPAYCLRAASESHPVVVEFNQHCGTLNIGEIVTWAVVCTELVLTCLNKANAALPKNGSTIFTFLEAQGLNRPSHYFKTKDKAFQIPDLKDWPLIRSSVAQDESEPVVRTNWPSKRALPSPLDEFAFRARNWEASAKDAFSSNYSFGVELEMYIPALPSQDLTLSQFTMPTISEVDSEHMDIDLDLPGYEEYPDPHPEDDRQVALGLNFEYRARGIAHLITSCGPLLLVRNSSAGKGRDVWKEELLKHGITPVNGIAPEYQTWTISEDGSVHPHNNWGGYLSLTGIEIVSPVLRDAPKGWEEVIDIVSILRNNFRLVMGNSCGFHIHVAKGTEPMPLHLLRKVLVLMCCAENIIFSLCNPARRHGKFLLPMMSPGMKTHDHYEDWWADIDTPADFEQYIPVDKIIDRCLLGVLKMLWTARTLKDLQGLCRPSDWALKGCVSVYSCIPLEETGSQLCEGTVEFRYLEGTLDPELILRWSQLMVSLFQFADMAPPNAWLTFVPTVLQSQKSGCCSSNILRSFLMQLGLKDDFEFWASRIRAISEMPQLSRDEFWKLNDERPGDDDEILSRVDKSHIDSLRINVCKRERRLLCLVRPSEKVNELEPPADPESRIRSLLEKISLTTDNETENSPKDDSGTTSGSNEGRTESGILEILRVSRNQVKKNLERYYSA
ncbi:hypothetical protein F66182_1995 [Fusarium sp. NRRL 66182]|nr:hypothetical protein F66182_1995 [Fusarium sp. NRRL 66182]